RCGCCRRGSWRRSERPDGHRDGVPAAQAERRDALLRLAIGEGVQERGEGARAAAADRVPEGHRAAVHVDALALEAELADQRPRTWSCDGRFAAASAPPCTAHAPRPPLPPPPPPPPASAAAPLRHPAPPRGHPQHTPPSRS